MEPCVHSVRAPGLQAVKIVKWKVRKGSKVSLGAVLGLYEVSEDKADKNAKSAELKKLKSSHVGTILEIVAKEGHVIPSGSIILQIQACTHPTVMKDMCADCGADLRNELGFAGDRKESVSAAVAMVHSIPELIVSEEQALELGRADEDRLRQTRKLVLLVDLDQTLIHTTNDNIPPNLKGIHHFQLLHGTQMLWYHTRLRPHTNKFLEKISKLYELHICTFGVRMYAHTIARIIDQDGKFFSHRILSRDECFNASSKTANLKALFPCGDSMVCIIDDREDVWNFAPNLIHVKPYRFFQGTADINAPPGLAKDENDNKPLKHKVRRISPFSTGERNNKDSKSEGESSDDHFIKNANDDTGDMKEEIEWEDDDDYLLYLEEVLVRIHKVYFDFYEQMIKENKVEEANVIDIKNIIPYVKRKVFKCVNILFSGMFPLKSPPEKCRAYIVAKALGANIHLSFVPPSGGSNENCTTHVVAARNGTSKVNLAKRYKKIHLVNPEWLWACAERWERVDERTFPLVNGNSLDIASRESPDIVQREQKPVGCQKRKKEDIESSGSSSENYPEERRRKHNNSSPSQMVDSVENEQLITAGKTGKSPLNNDNAASNLQRKFSTTYNPLLTFSDEEIATMDKEVEELLDEEGSDWSDNECNEEAEARLREQVLIQRKVESSSEDSLSEEFPRVWREKSKRKLRIRRKKHNLAPSQKDEEDSEESVTQTLVKSVEVFVQDSGSSNNESDNEYNESIGSVDEEMAEAVEKEFMSR